MYSHCDDGWQVSDDVLAFSRACIDIAQLSQTMEQAGFIASCGYQSIASRAPVRYISPPQRDRSYLCAMRLKTPISLSGQLSSFFRISCVEVFLIMPYRVFLALLLFRCNGRAQQTRQESCWFATEDVYHGSSSITAWP